ncbi:MAG: adenosine kinase [Deltaproteobacteria bacterium]|nr:adenosine kinase [Deltaproteobacteria bacterium]MBW2217942.1 adenosine kinase [Deltaproteobacteria bacterium]
MDRGKKIIGLGSALVDILVNENDDFLADTGAKKGGMTLVDSMFIENALSKTDGKPHVVPGGSACNTIIGISRLGGNGCFVGKCGEDELGEMFEKDLKENRVNPMLFRSSTPTGRVLSVVTPDAQRTMFTYLGASSEMMAKEITEKSFEGASIVHIEGYLLFNQELMLCALQTAKTAGARVSLDLASFNVVEQSKDILNEIVSKYVDILIANEDEARIFTGYADEDSAVSALGKNVEVAVLKLGKQGSIIFNQGKAIRVEPVGSGDIIDTTGAGDLWASGFLFGLENEFPYEKCGALASACGYEVCRVMGANIPKEGWARINKGI